jgi:ArsR family transcriptional regulator
MPDTRPTEPAFSQATHRLATLAKALGHPARIAILQTLAQRQRCVCGEIVEVLPLAQATVSQHLRELKAAGLVQGTIEGRHSCYCLNPEGLAALRTHFEGLYNELMPAAQEQEQHGEQDCC